jgi:hypothetical protein
MAVVERDTNADLGPYKKIESHPLKLPLWWLHSGRKTIT